MVGQALVTRRVSIYSLLAELARSPGHPGQKALRRIIATAEPTRSEAEDLLLDAVLNDHAITGFKANQYVPGVGELDFFDEKRGIALEFDSREFHDNPIQRGDDRAKQARAEAKGIQVLRLRWRDITIDRAKTAARIRRHPPRRSPQDHPNPPLQITLGGGRGDRPRDRSFSYSDGRAREPPERPTS